MRDAQKHGGSTDANKVDSRSKKKISSKQQSEEKILNTDETPFTESFQRGPSSLLFGVVHIAKRSVCLLPLSTTFAFCEDIEDSQPTPTIDPTKSIPSKRLRTKKETRAKQFIRSHVTKLGADDKVTERRVDEAMKTLYKTPSLPPLQTPPLPAAPPEKSSKRSRASKKKSRSKKNVSTSTEQSPVESASSTPKIPAASSPRLRTISEVIREEASTLLISTHADRRTSEDIQEETNESVHERAKYTERSSSPTPSTTSSNIVEQSETNSNGDNRQSQDTTESAHDQFDVHQNKDSS